MSLVFEGVPVRDSTLTLSDIIGKLTGCLQGIVNALQRIANSEIPEMPIIFRAPVTIGQN
jgi:hypothetical protein